jgi:DNA-binding response OmpR family regulator
MIGRKLFQEEYCMSKILIVDDDKQATTLLEKVLKAEGFEAVSVNDSSIAIQAAKSINPDLFLLDLMMPDPDGFKLCRMLRADPNFTHTPIIIITALDDGDSKIVAFGAGANDYITKPFHIDELADRVKALIIKLD